MRVSSSYEHSLQAIYNQIGSRGIRVDTSRLEEGIKIVEAEILRNLAICTNQWGCTVYLGAENEPDEDETTTNRAVNINSSSGKRSFLAKLKELGYEVPKITKKNEEGDYEQQYSAGELAIQKMLSTNQFNYPGGDPALKAVLRIRELGKLRSSYFNARLLSREGDSYFLSQYNVAGTLSGRRSSKKHSFGFGANAQNIPEHSSVAHLYRRCLVAREGNIFLFTDQVSAEDWPVCALSYNLSALSELRSGVDRHSKLASMIFSIPLESRTEKEWKKSTERYLGKRTRHASNYDMTAPRMSDALAQEGFSYSIPQCKVLLERVAQIDPSIKGVFHKYIQETLSSTRVLVTPEPFFRERQFLGARPNDYNSTVFKEAYSYIPQSTVGDNTGYTVMELESSYPSTERAIVQEGHDSIVQDIPKDPDTILKYLNRTTAAFRRKIRFSNGIELEIPIEAKLGYDFNNSIKLQSFTGQAIKEVLEQLEDEKSKNSQLVF